MHVACFMLPIATLHVRVSCFACYMLHVADRYTARDGVLLGTMRGLALRLCDELGMDVIEDAPTIAQLRNAEEMFISSTSRWVLPVREVILPDGEHIFTRSTELGDKLYRALLDHALENSTKLDLT